MSQKPDLFGLAYRLATLETSIYRYRCSRLRSISTFRQAVLDKVDSSFHQVSVETDRSYHSLAKELRAIRKYLSSLGFSVSSDLDSDSELDLD